MPVADVFYNSKNAVDVNNDGFVSPSDALAVINELTSNGSRRLVTKSRGMLYVDVNNDGFLSPSDALKVINRLNQLTAAGVRNQTAASPARRVDAAFAIATVDNAEQEAELSANRPVALPTSIAEDRIVDLEASMIDLIYDDFRDMDQDAESSDQEEI